MEHFHHVLLASQSDISERLHRELDLQNIKYYLKIITLVNKESRFETLHKRLGLFMSCFTIPNSVHFLHTVSLVCTPHAGQWNRNAHMHESDLIQSGSLSHNTLGG